LVAGVEAFRVTQTQCERENLWITQSVDPGPIFRNMRMAY